MITKSKYRLLTLFIPILCMLICFTSAVELPAQDNQFDISQRGYTWSDYSIAQNDAGYVVAVWYDERNSELFEGDEHAGAIYGRLFDPDLNPMGSDFRISQPIKDGLARQPGVILLDDGRYVVVWNESVRPIPNSPSQRRIIMTMRSIDGEVLIPETDVADNPEELTISSPSIYKLPGERYLVTWNVPSLRRYGQYYFMDGTPDGGNVSMIHPELNLYASGVHVAGDELYFMSYIEQPREARWIQYYDISHSPVGNPIRLEQRGRITPFGADSLLVEYTSENRDEIFIQFLSAEGSVLSDPILVNDDGGIQPKTLAKIAHNSSDGSFMVVWEDGRNGLPTSSFTVRDIYAQRFDGDGRPVGGNFKVNHEEWENSQMLPDILYRGNNQYLITWGESRIRCPIRQPRPPGELIPITVNIRDSYIAAVLMDYDRPDPGRVLGWDYLQSQCDGVKSFELMQNYPNPFNQSTNLVIQVNMSLGPGLDMHIKVYDVLGRKVREFNESYLRSGTHEIPFDAGGLASGLYFIRATSPQVRGLTQTMTMMLVK
jgi:hypothetical protein